MMLALTILACGSSSDIPVVKDNQILYQDDFSDPNSGWDQVDQAGEASTGYSGEAYKIKVITTNMDVWANPDGQSFTDVRVDVKTTKVTGSTDNNDFGLICRYKNASNFYFFIISSDGYYGIGKVKDGDQVLLGMDNMLPSDQINLGDTDNQLRADCIGKELTLFVNGHQIYQIKDKDFSEGNVGLIAGTFDESYTEIMFDDFKVQKP